MLLAASLSLVGAGAANAVGSCTSTPYDYGSGRIYSNCSGVVHITWKCSTDLWGTLNDRSHNFGAGSVYVFKACDAGYPHSIGFYGV